jgi:hexosaminidase
VPTVAKLQYQILPRLFALSEVAWSKPENKDYTNFSEVRLAKHFARLDAIHYNYRVPTALPIIDTVFFGDKFTFAPKSVVPGAKIYYTLNGRDPLDTDLEYVSPITIYVPANEKREFKTRVITPSGRRSIATRTLMCNRALMPAVNYNANKPGLSCKMVKSKFTVPDQLDFATAKDSVIVDKLNAETPKKDNPHFGMLFDGYVNVPADGAYNFTQSSYTDTQLFIDGEKITESESALPLAKGFHKIRVKYIYNAPIPVPGSYRTRQTPLRILVTAPGSLEKKEFDAAMLFN